MEKYKWDKAKGVFTTGQYELLSEKQRLKTEGQQVQEQEPRHLYVCSWKDVDATKTNPYERLGNFNLAIVSHCLFYIFPCQMIFSNNPSYLA